MNKKQTMTALVLTGIALLLSATAMAADLPAQDGRMWAPTGDLVGMENHATAGATSWDPHGAKSKYSEDWQQEEDLLFNGLFGFNTILENGRHITLRGFGESGHGTIASRITLLTSKPNKCRVSLDFRNFNNYYDPTSEMRASSFSAPPAPSSLSGTPELGWTKGKINFAYNLGKGVGLDLGFNQMKKDGVKASLLRGGGGARGPKIKTFDTTVNEFYVGLGYGGPKLDVKAQGTYRQTDGDRLVGNHAYSDDQTLFRMGLDATFRLGSKTSLLGLANTSKLEADNSEVYNSTTFSPVGEAKSTMGRLALISRLGKATAVRFTVGMGSYNTDFQTDLASVIQQMTVRERSSTDVGLLVTNNSFNKTRLRFDYRLRKTNLEDTVSEIGGSSQNVDQDRTSQRINFRADRRLSRKTTLKAKLGYRMLQVDQTNTGDDIFYTMGDRKQSRLSGRLALQTRPSNKVRFDFGIQGHGACFEREDIDNVETTNSATQGFLGLNVFASDRLTLVGTGSYGLEKYETTDGPVAGPGMGPLTYEGTTLRMAPGVIMQVTNSLEMEAHYEAIRFEDPGDAPDDGNQLKSDLDRILLRAGYRVGETMKISATYRRHEFDENRWDDYIMDLYSLSVSGRF